MKKLIFLALATILFSCSSTPVKKWDAVTASATCFDAATKGKYDLTDPEIKRLHGICDCVGEKMVSAYKTEAEANEKMLEATTIANECSEEYTKGQIQDLGK